MQGIDKLDSFPHCVPAAAAAIEEQSVRHLHWTKLFSQRECLTVFPNYCCPERWFRLNRISHPDWVKLCVELNYAPNKNMKIPSATISCKVSIYRNIECVLEGMCLLPCWLSLLGFDEIPVVVFEAGKSLTEKVEQERNGLQNVYIFVGLTAGSQNVRERECCLCKSKWKERECVVSVSQRVRVLSMEVTMERMSSWKMRVYIGNPCRAVGSKWVGQNQSCRHSC